MEYNLATYLIDFENVRSDGLRGVNWLSENDTVVIFYSNNADTLTFEAMDLILNSNAAIRKFKIARGGKNALDFQLATYLGFLIHENENPYFYIISRDNGFHYVIDFWKRTYRYEGYVFCCPSIAEAYSKQKRFDSYSQAEKEAIIEEMNQEELETDVLEEDAFSPEPDFQEQPPESGPDEPDTPPLDFVHASALDSPDQPDFASNESVMEAEDLELTDSAAESDPQPNEPFGQAAADVPTLSDMEMHEAPLTSNSQVPMAAVIIQEAAVCTEPSMKKMPAEEIPGPEPSAVISEDSSSSEQIQSPTVRTPSKRPNAPARRTAKTEKKPEDTSSADPIESVKSDSDAKPVKQDVSAPRRQTRSRKSSENADKKENSKTPSKAKKPNLGELPDDLLLPFSSAAVQKAISLTGELCSEKQAQIAASHLIRSSGKQDFYRKMTAYFGQKHGIAVYNSLRSEYTNIRKNEA